MSHHSDRRPGSRRSPQPKPPTPKPRFGEIRLFATTPAGLEPLCARELVALGARGVYAQKTGVSFLGDHNLMARACASLRVAHRILWNVGEGSAASPDALYDTVRQVADWPTLIPPDKTFATYATARDSVFNDARFASLRCKDAIVDSVRDAVGTRPSVDPQHPDVVVRIGVRKKRVVVSLDAAGKHSLHVRGYRTDSGAAPLRETLAAGMLRLADYRGDEPLFDPLCGSGTLLIEGALIAMNRIPGVVARDNDRAYGFMSWPGFVGDARAAYNDFINEARAAEAEPSVRISGSDISRPVLGAAADNAVRAGLDDFVRLKRLDIKKLVPPLNTPPGLIVGNPPYGERMGDTREALELMRTLGDRLRADFKGWRACFILPSSAFADALGLPIRDRMPTRNGALDVSLVLFDIP